MSCAGCCSFYLLLCGSSPQVIQVLLARAEAHANSAASEAANTPNLLTTHTSLSALDDMLNQTGTPKGHQPDSRHPPPFEPGQGGSRNASRRSPRPGSPLGAWPTSGGGAGAPPAAVAPSSSPAAAKGHAASERGRSPLAHATGLQRVDSPRGATPAAQERAVAAAPHAHDDHPRHPQPAMPPLAMLVAGYSSQEGPESKQAPAAAQATLEAATPVCPITSAMLKASQVLAKPPEPAMNSAPSLAPQAAAAIQATAAAAAAAPQSRRAQRQALGASSFAGLGTFSSASQQALSFEGSWLGPAPAAQSMGALGGSAPVGRELPDFGTAAQHSSPALASSSFPLQPELAGCSDGRLSKASGDPVSIPSQASSRAVTTMKAEMSLAGLVEQCEADISRSPAAGASKQEPKDGNELKLVKVNTAEPLSYRATASIAHM